MANLYVTVKIQPLWYFGIKKRIRRFMFWLFRNQIEKLNEQLSDRLSGSVSEFMNEMEKRGHLQGQAEYYVSTSVDIQSGECRIYYNSAAYHADKLLDDMGFEVKE